jgi:SAM-dependent methyltransferase
MPRDATRDYYEEHAEDYFDQTHAVDLESLWARSRETLTPGALILDLGCGSGRDALYFAGAGFQVFGVDYAQSLLKLAKDFARQPMVLGDFRALPFRDSTFDAVWSIGSLLHTQRQSISYILSQIHRVLKPGAILFASVKKGQGATTDALGRYNVFYLREEWEYILRKSAYTIIDIEETVEMREIRPGHTIEIVWITSLARASGT